MLCGIATTTILVALSTAPRLLFNIWIVRIQEREHNGDDVPDIYTILQHFRNYIRVQNAQKAQASHGAFASPSFQNQKLDGKEKEDKDNRPCLCGKLHRFKACWYLMKELWLSNWKPDLAIQRQIDEKMQKSMRLRETIDRICKQESKKDNNEQTDPANFSVSVFSNKLSEYQLRDSDIPDPGASFDICNGRSRFRTFNPAVEESFVYVSDTVIPIEGFGQATVTIQAPSGPRKIELMDAAYIPSFHTSVASLEKFILKNVHRDTVGKIAAGG